MTTKQQLKMWFSKGKYPLASQFAEWLESYWHKSEKIPMSTIDGLTDELNDKVSSSALAAKQNVEDEGLETGDKTVVGAINELLRRKTSAGSVEYIKGANIENAEEALNKIFDIISYGYIHLNFDANNGQGWISPNDCTLLEVVSDNVKSLTIMTDDLSQDVDIKNILDIDISKGKVVRFQITRINPEINAELMIGYVVNLLKKTLI